MTSGSGLTAAPSQPALPAARLVLEAAVPAVLAGARAFVADACRARGAPTDVVDALVLAVDEVCANVMAHGYPAGAPGPLTLDVDVERRPGEPGALLVTVRDAARAFDPADAPAPALDLPADARPLGGLGWHLVRRSVDEVRYVREHGENVVTLVRRLAAPPA